MRYSQRRYSQLHMVGSFVRLISCLRCRSQILNYFFKSLLMHLNGLCPSPPFRAARRSSSNCRICRGRSVRCFFLVARLALHFSVADDMADSIRLQSSAARDVSQGSSNSHVASNSSFNVASKSGCPLKRYLCLRLAGSRWSPPGRGSRKVSFTPRWSTPTPMSGIAAEYDA